MWRRRRVPPRPRRRSRGQRSEGAYAGGEERGGEGGVDLGDALEERQAVPVAEASPLDVRQHPLEAAWATLEHRGDVHDAGRAQGSGLGGVERQDILERTEEEGTGHGTSEARSEDRWVRGA